MNYRQIATHGPGGRKCSCCFPAGGKGRKLAKKQDEKKVRHFFSNLLRKEIVNKD